MASPKALREFRALTTTFQEAHTNAATDTWTAATKYRVVDYDDSGCVREGIEDASLETRMYTKRANIPGLATGTLKFSVYTGGATTDTTACAGAVLANVILSGIQAPTNARTGAVGAGTSTVVNVLMTSANTYAVPGMAVLVGTKGDGKGNGEVKPIIATDDTWLLLGVACNAAPEAADPLVFSTTVYPDEDATQMYLSTLALGHATADQKQTISCFGKMGISGLGSTEPPRLDFELTATDHQTCAANARATISHSNVASGTDPAFNKGIGSCQLGDYASNARSIVKSGEFSVDPGMAYEAIPSLGGMNGIGGAQKIPSVPMAEFTLLWDEDMPGLRDDFEASTAKRCIMQFGHTAAKTFAVELTKAYLDVEPTSQAIGALAGVRIKMHGSEDYNQGATDLNRAGLKLHWF